MQLLSAYHGRPIFRRLCVSRGGVNMEGETLADLGKGLVSTHQFPWQDRHSLVVVGAAKQCWGILCLLRVPIIEWNGLPSQWNVQPYFEAIESLQVFDRNGEDFLVVCNRIVHS